MNILLTGGAGYIGSHTAVVLSEAGHTVVLLDNFCNSCKNVLKQLREILGEDLPCIDGDVRDTGLLIKTMQDYKINAVIHFAGLKAVGESTEEPIKYYANNVQGTISLLEAMQSTKVKTLVFSSSATVYGDPKYLPIDEDHPTGATNPYGRSKLHIEEMLKDVSNSDVSWKIICLRYFNPVGAHPTGLLGENPNGIPSNLVPYISQVACGKRPYLNIFGSDYSTVDGTGERDFIHVMDLAEGHLFGLDYLISKGGYSTVNLGTGNSVSVLQILREFSEIVGKEIPFKFSQRRAGDVSRCVADNMLAKKLLNWSSKRGLKEMCSSQWLWQKNIK